MSAQHTPSVRDVMDCQQCGWQGRAHECDSTYCPICGGECAPWGDIYNEDGTPKEDRAAIATTKQEPRS